MTEEELAVIIDLCYRAVERSCIGKIVEKREDGVFLHVLPQQTFLTLLGRLVPSRAEGTMSAKMEMKEPKESWQGEE